MNSSEKRFSWKKHLFHAVFTCGTFGLWLPFWILHYLFVHRVSPIKAFQTEHKNEPPYRKIRVGLIKFSAITALFVILWGVAISSSAYEERQWQKTKAELIVQITAASQQGDYQKALDLFAPHQEKRELTPNLKAALHEAHTWKREQERLLAEQEKTRLIARIQALHQETDHAAILSLFRQNKELLSPVESLNPILKEAQDWKEQQREIEQIEREKKRRLAKEEKEKQRQEKARQLREEQLARFKWKYRADRDSLTNKKSHHAWVKSLNRVNFSFPYQGEQRAQLELRTHPQHGKDLILSVEKGQMLVRSYEETSVKVVFDKKSPQTYSVIGPSDHGTTSLFFKDYHGFVQRMLKAQKVKIEVPFYQQGNVVFEFLVEDFDSNSYLNR